MTHFLKHTALRIWASIALGVPLSLGVLPPVQAQFGLSWAPVLSVAVVIVAFFGIGWLFNRMGLALADRRVREAGVWERSGDMAAAERTYADAAAIFDSFLISPRVRRRRSTRITSHLVRFYLARGDGEGRFRHLVTAYVRTHPEDSEVAEAWLRRISGVSAPELSLQEAALRIGEAHEARPDIQRRLAWICLAAGRTDFSAQTVYRRVLQVPGDGDREMVRALADRFVQEGRVDDWALEIYLKACADTGGQDPYLRGVAACVHWLPENPGNARALGEGRRWIASIEEQRLGRMRTGFVPPEDEAPASRPGGGQVLARRAVAGTAQLSRIVFQHTARLINLTKNGLAGAAERLGRSPRMRRSLIWAGVAAASAGILIFLVHTAGHLLQPRTEPVHTPVPAPAPVTDKFTIQVAAYLKRVHAERFVTELRQQGIDAYWAEASGKNKRWFQVRVHHFPDKAAARAYGETLKGKGIIDDFYVANYQRP